MGGLVMLNVNCWVVKPAHEHLLMQQCSLIVLLDYTFGVKWDPHLVQWNPQLQTLLGLRTSRLKRCPNFRAEEKPKMSTFRGSIPFKHTLWYHTHLSSFDVFLFLSSPPAMTPPPSPTSTLVVDTFFLPRPPSWGSPPTTPVSLSVEGFRSRFAFSAARRCFFNSRDRMCWRSSSSHKRTKVETLGAWRIRWTTKGVGGREGGKEIRGESLDNVMNILEGKAAKFDGVLSLPTKLNYVYLGCLKGC